MTNYGFIDGRKIVNEMFVYLRANDVTFYDVEMAEQKLADEDIIGAMTIPDIKHLLHIKQQYNKRNKVGLMYAAKTEDGQVWVGWSKYNKKAEIDNAKMIMTHGKSVKMVQKFDRDIARSKAIEHCQKYDEDFDMSKVPTHIQDKFSKFLDKVEYHYHLSDKGVLSL